MQQTRTNGQRHHHLCCILEKGYFRGSEDLNLRIAREICCIAHLSTQATVHSCVNIAHHRNLSGPLFLFFLPLLVQLKCQGLLPAAIEYLHAINKAFCSRQSGDRCVAGLFGFAFF